MDRPAIYHGIISIRIKRQKKKSNFVFTRKQKGMMVKHKPVSPYTPSSPHSPLIPLRLSWLTAAGNLNGAQVADGNMTGSAIPLQIRSRLVGSLHLSDWERSAPSPCLAHTPHTHTYTYIPALYTGTKPGDKHSNSSAIRSRFSALHCNPACRLENTKTQWSVAVCSGF